MFAFIYLITHVHNLLWKMFNNYINCSWLVKWLSFHRLSIWSPSLSLSLSLSHMCLCAERCFATIHLQIIAFISYWSTDSFDGLVKSLFLPDGTVPRPFLSRQDYILNKNGFLGVFIDQRLSTWESEASKIHGRVHARHGYHCLNAYCILLYTQYRKN